MIRNTLLYCGLAAGIDVLLGVTIAYLMLRTHAAGAPVAGLDRHRVAGGAGHRAGHRLPAPVQGHHVPGTDVLLTSTWVMIMLAYAVRRLPYALRSCVAALQQVHVSLEEAAESLGATKLRTIRAWWCR
jgi:iron(III) transport system permease protein